MYDSETEFEEDTIYVFRERCFREIAKKSVIVFAAGNYNKETPNHISIEAQWDFVLSVGGAFIDVTRPSPERTTVTYSNETHAPAGLWGSELKPDLNAERLIKNTIGGFEIIPAKKPEAGETRSIENNELQFSTHITPDSFAWEEVNKKRQVTIEDQEKVFERFHKDTDKRDSLLSALGFESEQDIDVSVERDGKLLSDIQVL